MRRRLSLIAFLALPAALALGAFAVRADTSPEEINALQDRINEREARLDQVERRMDEYRTRITQLERQATSLAAEVELFDNRLELVRLDVESNREEIASVTDQIALLEMEMQRYEEQLARNRAMLSDVLRRIQTYDNDFSLQLLFGTDSFSELFDRLTQLTSVNNELKTALEEAERAKEQVETARLNAQGRRESLLVLEEELKRNLDRLEEEKAAKESLLAASEASEAQYRSLVGELRQETDYINYQVRQLQGEIEAKLANADLGDVSSSILSWPVDPGYRGISARFHDPTYPFRHLFEHSGLDIPQPQGTPVAAAAPGYVAWTRSGPSYGNYIMIIHANGVATLYAHLSRINVVADQFVGRGETIALSGGAAGSPGAGLSTGPHLHFEVRKDGIPVDPMGYLAGN